MLPRRFGLPDGERQARIRGMHIPYDRHRWTSHLFDIHGSMVREILGRVSVSVLFAVAVVLVHQWGSPYGISLAIPDLGHALIGGALGLLLVFRTNSSYDRFWEGRKLWGGIVNETRNLARQASEYLREEPELARQLIAWTTAFAHASRRRLRGEAGLGTEDWVQRLPVEGRREADMAAHAPLAVARQLTRCVEQARQRRLITDHQQWLFDQNIGLLIGYIGACERIHQTPLPYAYAVHLRRALIMYCGSLPLALVSRFGWMTVPAVLVLCYILYGIEEIGVEIEDPFGTDANDLPLEQICDGITSNLLDVDRTLSA
jgi:ion channel-forming bestrophin family protein